MEPTDGAADTVRSHAAASPRARGSRRATIAAAAIVLATGVGVTAARLREAAPPPAATADCRAFDHTHARWNDLLTRFVRDGAVDYAGWAAAAQPELDAYLRALEAVCVGDHDGWSRHQQLAFWINAYNAYTVRLILHHLPLGSIRDIGVLPGAAFRDAFIELRWLTGGPISLNDIEHAVLRARLAEPRIHFAIVCASASCPVLRAEAFRADTLDVQLDDAARAFVRDPTRNRYDAATKTLWLSAIFDWFGEDFVKAAGSVPAYVAGFADDETAAAIRDGDVRVRYLDYDWALNQTP